ncbi:MAG: tRNA (adenosine(37)-N6)-threonylcarbamoyltransferase complex ATPase subunit type 1 TsaE [Bacteroidales bacterium]|jgi:tRNA threonylcarbamoyladenosine biosynthesis protein TsaE|nr:tRNA (adenosine(37)-N6)-threonylcarbamoyltransferase complex ATPase subunit type 1 TsaE [Bacteroidales bacterium]
MTSINFGLQDIDTVARRFLQMAGARKHFAFYGDMGAGKTSFIKAVCKALGVQNPATSPTFALVNEYETGDGSPIYHFDFYRINKPEEVFDFGCEEYFASGHYCFVEWAEKAETALPDDICKVYLEETEQGLRKLTLLHTEQK